jgi:hypothetical protein
MNAVQGLPAPGPPEMVKILLYGFWSRGSIRIPMPTQTLPHSTRAPSGNVCVDAAAVEAALRKIIPADLEERLLAHTANWLLIVSLFKDLEIAYTRSPDDVRQSFKLKYRAALSAVMALGDSIRAAVEAKPELDYTGFGFSRQAIDCNAAYLHDKYAQWFFPRDEREVNDDFALITNEGIGAA